MANTADTSKSGHIMQVTYSGSGDDWNYKGDGGYGPGAIVVKAIIWHPTADGDVLVINEGGIDGPSIVHWEASDSGVQPQITFSPPVRLRPYIDLTDCTFNTVTSTKIIFILA